MKMPQFLSYMYFVNYELEYIKVPNDVCSLPSVQSSAPEVLDAKAPAPKLFRIPPCMKDCMDSTLRAASELYPSYVAQLGT